MPSNPTIAGLAGALIFAGASAVSNGVLDRFVLASVAAGSGFIASMGLTADRRRTHQDEIAIAVRKSKMESDRLRVQLETNHGLEISKIRTNLQRQIDSLNAEKQALEAEYQAERTRIQNEYEERLNGTFDKHASAIQGTQTEHARTLIRELKERDERIDAMVRDRTAAIGELHSKIADLTGQLERAKLDREELMRLDLGRDLHAMELQRKDDTIAILENQVANFEARKSELEEFIDAGFDEATQAGFKEAAEQASKVIAELEREHTHQIGELEAKIGRLETQLDRRKSHAAFEQSLPTLASIIGERLIPLLITGNQRAGKGTTGVEAIRLYGGRSEIGAIAIGFDSSEARKKNGTFARAGIPTIGDASLILELMEAIEANKHRRPLTSEPEAANVPRIILAIDELGTCIDDLDKESRTRFGELFKHTYQNWLKFGIVPILLGHSPQIQNLECGGIQLLNGGHAHTAFTNILVCDVIEKFAKDNGGTTADLTAYLQAYDEQFTSAYFKKGKLHPMKHASHHGKTWSDNVPPHDKSPIRLAPCPDWFPHAVRQLYTPYYESAVAENRAGASECITSAGASDVPPAKAAPHQDLHADPILQRWGRKAEELGFSPDELRALVSCAEAGKNQADSLRSALGIKSRSGNPDSAYQRGRSLYQAIKAALVTA